MASVYIALGANLGDRRANLRRGLELLPPLVRVQAVSALYESRPQPPAPPPAYLNAAVSADTDLEPAALLQHLKGIERALGREAGERWAPRPLDLDIILYDDLVLETPELVIPHPRLRERAFVLRPLLDIDPELRDPRDGVWLADVLAELGEEGLTRIEDEWQA